MPIMPTIVASAGNTYRESDNKPLIPIAVEGDSITDAGVTWMNWINGLDNPISFFKMES